MLLPEPLYYLHAYIILLFEPLLLDLLLKVLYGLEQCLDLAGVHLIKCLDLGLRGGIALLVLLALLREERQLLGELSRLPLQHHDHLVFLVLEHLNKNYYNEILSLNLNIREVKYL